MSDLLPAFNMDRILLLSMLDMLVAFDMSDHHIIFLLLSVSLTLF